VGQQVELIYDYIRQRELLTRSTFIDKVDAHILLFKRWQVSKSMSEHTTTTTMEGPSAALMDLLDEQRLKLHKEAFDFRVFRLPAEQKAWTLGRTSANDLAIGHRSISKQHATLSRGADASVLVGDNGSKNGTWVENKRVSPDRPVLIWTKQALRIGSIGLRFLVAGDFYDLLGGLVTPA
jgi:pSer/pThr/pTyr-binding forkhead associated (FHA) protein